MPNFLTDSDTETPDVGTVPGYLVAADNHNLGNTRGGSWFDADSWGDKFENAGKFLSVSLMSGANSFYNTGVTVGNWFGAEAELNDTKDWISGLDTDLGTYYDQNRQAADLVGFIAGSLIPGLGGVKIFNAGQTALKAVAARGILGENLSRATGLLVPQTQKFITLAAHDITNATATFSAINQAGIKALASGVWQNTLEAAAFETAVQATMFKSPILDNQDGWDIAKNIAIGGIVGGVIGGAFAGAASLGSIKKLVKVADADVKPFSSRLIPEEGTSPAQKIILMTEDKDSSIATMAATGADNPLGANFEVSAKAHIDKLRRVDNDIRSNVHAMVPGDDSQLGNMVADTIYGADARTTMQNLLHAEEITRVGRLSKIEIEANKLAKDGKIAPELQTGYVKLTGEGSGVVTDAKPAVLNIADTIPLKSGQSAEEAILKNVRDRGFSTKKVWNSLDDISPVTGHLDAEARYIWADKIVKEIPEGTKIHQYDIPLLERAYKDGQLNVQLVDSKGAVVSPNFQSKDALYQHLLGVKDTVANELLLKQVLKGNVPVEQGTEAIAKIVNTKLGRLEGTNVGDPTKDYFARQSAKESYTQFLEAKGLTTPAGDLDFLPTYAKISKRVQDMETNGHVLDGMTWIKQQQGMLKNGVENVFAKATGKLAQNVPEITQSALMNSNRYGAGAGLFSFANGGYGTLESTAQLLGSITKQIKTAFRQDTSDLLQGPLVKLGTKQDTAIEFETINQKISRSTGQFVLDTENVSGEAYALIRKDVLDKVQKGELEVTGGMDGIIPIVNEETYEAVRAHISRSGSRTQTYKELRAAQGLTDEKPTDVFRPIRPSTKDYPYFAFVKDPRVTGSGHTTMIHAASENELKQLIDKVPAEYSVLTKKDTEEFFQARNEYDYQRTLHESAIDSNLKSKGIFSNFFSKTDPQKIVDDILQQHLREDDTLAIELMRAKNQNAFDYLEDQGKAYSKVEQSKFGAYGDRLESAKKNPYLDYIKTSLDISKASEQPLLYGFNKALDSAVSRGVARISEVFQKAKSPAELEEINKILDSHGMNTGYRDAVTDLLANHTAPKGELTKFIRGANALLSKLTLGLDPLNAVNNFIGANILRSTELKQITDAINAGDTELAGALGNLTKVKLPGVSDSITSPTKLVANAIQNYVKDTGPLLARYKQLGVVKDATQQFRDIIDDFTLKGTETVQDLNSRLSRAFAKVKDLSEVGEKFTGNKLAEEMNRFISADVMRQLTDLGVAKKLLTPAEQASYINTFVNRVEGNTLASQRPLMFQGPIGQAVGLFQSYQFNLMQQMFRYVAEGSAKDSAMLLGLQGTFFGIQGLPAFQFINQHIIGTASGNQKHVDLYDSTYGVLGRQLGDLALYGLPSNLLQTNLYSRGDINPRQVTVIPTTLPDIPIVGAFGKFLGSVKETVSKIAGGGNVWQSMLQGLEHNGLSRPLAGLAQTFQAAGPSGQVFSTTNKGSILFSNDLMSWATATRLAGGRPLDEAIINDGVFRIQSYQQMDRDKMTNLAETIRSTAIQGETASQDSIIKFAKSYAESGGKQMQFNKFMMNQFKGANTNQAEKIVGQLQNPFAQKMQLLMGGGSDVTPLSALSAPE